MHDLAHVSWVGYGLHRFCTTYHDDRCGTTRKAIFHTQRKLVLKIRISSPFTSVLAKPIDTYFRTLIFVLAKKKKSFQASRRATTHCHVFDGFRRGKPRALSPPKEQSSTPENIQTLFAAARHMKRWPSNKPLLVNSSANPQSNYLLFWKLQMLLIYSGSHWYGPVAVQHTSAECADLPSARRHARTPAVARRKPPPA